MLTCLLALAPFVQDVTTTAPILTHESVHPSDATIFLELPDVVGMTAAYADSPIARMLRDPEWNAFAAKTMGEDPETFALDAWCAERFGELLDEVVVVADGEVDLRTAFTGLRSASVSLSVPTGEGEVGALCVLDYADAANADAGARFLAGTFELLPLEVQTKQAPLTLFGQEGLVQRYRSTTSEDGPASWSAICGSSVVFAVGAMTPERWRAMADDRARQMVAVVPPDVSIGTGELVESTPVYRARLRTDDVSATFARLAETEWAAAFARPLAAIDAYLPDGPIDRWCTTKLDESGFSGAGIDFGARCLPGVGDEPIPERAPTYLPPDAFAAWVTSVRAEALEGVLVDALAIVLEADADEARRFLAEDAHVDLAADLLAPLGTAAAAYVMPLAGPRVPDHGVVIELEDAERFTAAMEKLYDAVEARVGTRLAMRDGRYRGAETFSFSQHESIRALGVPSLGAADMLVDSVHLGVSIAVLEDRVVVSTDRRSATREVKRLTQLEEGAPLHPLAGAYDQGKTVSASIVDWGGFVGDVYDMARGLLQMSGMGEMMGIDFASMPERDAVTRYLGATTSRAFFGKDGETRARFSNGSFGPEVCASMVALGFVYAMPPSVTMRPVTAPAKPAEPVAPDGDADGSSSGGADEGVR